ncbi:hypothetical protein B0H14DRAFT_114478 [Mycena olivaceomarginata]|nr:hypothetical protein B0H14DRAFT_114478 [Mycena olivaceomarginata]
MRVSATSLVGCITVTATCTLSLDLARAGRRRTHCRGRCLAGVLCSMPPSAWATLSSSVCPTVSNAIGSSQPLAPSIHKTSDALLAAAYGRQDVYIRNTSPFRLRARPRPVLASFAGSGAGVDVLLVTYGRAGSEWRGHDGDATAQR